MGRRSTRHTKRIEILEAAAAVIAERGLSETRISDVAARFGASAPLILYYFDSKDELLAAALAHQSESFHHRIAAETEAIESAKERLWALIELSCPPVKEPEDIDIEWDLWLETWSRARHDPAVARARRKMDKLFRSTIAAIVTDGVARGEFTCHDPASFAVHLAALIDGLAIQVLLGDPAVKEKTMLALCLDVAARELGID